ncbi:MAG TPA: cupin domain-containing protein [Steroidobacteraceae bacterium]|jgi:quercetin dioxygenase-like cupin family protein|nr:cupin domain-containing protein [Steroidobacteraceae bacterium]
MRIRLVPVVASCLMAGTVLGAAADQNTAAAGGFVRLTAEQVHWQDLPDGHGAQMATIAGDPAGPGLYVQRVRFPPHVMDRPHWHPHDRYVTVLRGTWYTGTGATFDPARTVPLKPGSFMFHPARALHWDGSNSDEEVIVQVVGLGPADTTPADPSKPFWVELAR